ncbi:hypothetical protein LO772_24275 [Yinghuangia sp. ASG 101]|uniref:hypothetical protein n=1 Tax=Yinghuangia sp. ASG 101 TaxID=2896848 RepID=UPI001E4B1FAB|nr:hypothetical protein [Yinghuangia sp. ASG 101]UGQ09990.1 hypothetical protein LO772_24275 [Yinghuangia sp. ASG 101]
MDGRSPNERRTPRWFLLLVVFTVTAALGLTLGILGLTSSDQRRAALPAPAAPPSAGPRAETAVEPPGAVPRLKDHAELARLLDRRAAAFRDRDRDAFLATVDPRSPAFRDAQAKVFDNAAAVPFSSWEYEVVEADPFPLGDARRAVLGGTATATARVDLVYRVADFDTAPVRGAQYLTFVSRDGAWYLAADGDGDASGLHGAVQPWDLGPVHVLRTDIGIVLGVGDRVAELPLYQKDIETAVADVGKVWGDRWPGKAVVVVPADQAQMARMLGAEPQQYARIAAVTTGERGASADDAAADRVIVNPDAFRELGAIERRVVMTHEITHVASRAFTRNWTPTWLSEGFADYVGYLDAGQSVRSAAPELRRDVLAGKVPQSLPTDEQFATTHEALPQAYEMGWLACRLIAERWGQEKLVAFYRAAGTDGPGGGAPDQKARLAAAFADVLGTTPEEFTGAWIAYVTTQVR